MLIVRGTKKLRDRVKTAPKATDGDVSTTVLGDWFATPLMWKPQAVLLINATTFLPVFAPLAPAAKLLTRIPDAIIEVLEAHGVDSAVITSEAAAMSEVRVAATNSRQVLGVMNELIFHAEHSWEANNADLVAMSLNLADVILGPLEYHTPADELTAVLARTTPQPANNEGTPPPQAVSRRPHLTLVPNTPTPPPTPDAGGGLCQLKITIEGIAPPIWRRVVVSSSETLGHLHDVIQAAFGWDNTHLHDFVVGTTRYTVPDGEDFYSTKDERSITINAAINAGGSVFRYVYDMGDYWEHLIDIEDLDNHPDVVPGCVGGARACPPEDCGGVWGYDELLHILAKPDHDEHYERRRWLGRPFDPEAFDPTSFATNLRRQQAPLH